MKIYLIYSENQLKHLGRDSEFFNFKLCGLYAHIKW
jgi:hypothetical protein